jgi:Acyl-CoA hydrolase
MRNWGKALHRIATFSIHHS